MSLMRRLAKSYVAGVGAGGEAHRLSILIALKSPRTPAADAEIKIIYQVA